MITDRIKRIQAATITLQLSGTDNPFVIIDTTNLLQTYYYKNISFIAPNNEKSNGIIYCERTATINRIILEFINPSNNFLASVATALTVSFNKTDYSDFKETIDDFITVESLDNVVGLRNNTENISNGFLEFDSSTDILITHNNAKYDKALLSISDLNKLSNVCYNVHIADNFQISNTSFVYLPLNISKTNIGIYHIVLDGITSIGSNTNISSHQEFIFSYNQNGELIITNTICPNISYPLLLKIVSGSNGYMFMLSCESPISGNQSYNIAEIRLFTTYIANISGINNIVFPTSPIYVDFFGGSSTIKLDNTLYNISVNHKNVFSKNQLLAKLIPDNTNIANYSEPGYYYKSTNIKTLTNIPTSLDTGFVLYIYDSASSQPLHYIIKDRINNLHLGYFENGIITWKSLNFDFDVNGNLIIPSHTHTYTDIITDTYHRFVTDANIERWNNMVSGSIIWKLSIEVVSTPNYSYSQESMVKKLIQISQSAVETQIDINDTVIGEKGELIIENTSDSTITISLFFEGITKIYSNSQSLSRSINVDHSVLVKYHRLTETYIEVIFTDMVDYTFETLGTVVGEGDQLIQGANS